MPHSTVEYTANVADAFDRPRFAAALHATLVRVASGRPAACKTRFLRLDDTCIADGSDAYAMVHVGIGVLSGRTPELKRELSEAVLALLRQHVAALPAAEVQLSVDVHELDRETYTHHEEPPAGAESGAAEPVALGSAHSGAPGRRGAAVRA